MRAKWKVCPKCKQDSVRTITDEGVKYICNKCNITCIRKSLIKWRLNNDN